MPAVVEIDRMVRLDRKSTVFPALPSIPQRCRLCSSDLQMLGCNYIQKGLIYPMKENMSYDFRSLTEMLKKSLSETLVRFYPLAGRLAISAEGEVYIDCNDCGVEFIEASAPGVVVEEIMEQKIDPVVRELFALDGAININGQFLPLVVIQVTKLRDGIALGCTVNHATVDGTSLWHFINTWAQMCRDPATAIIALPPLHTRCFSAGLPIKLNLHHLKSPLRFSPPPFCEKIFHFTAETIAHLKSRANRSHKEKPPISSFQALSSHIWLCITRARKLPRAEFTTFKLAVNCRSRQIPPFPYSYFGNAIQFVSSTVSAGELLNADVSYAAGLLNRIIRAHQGASIKAELEKIPTIVQLDKGAPPNTVMMGSSPRFPMYDNDFGWGRPIGVRSGWSNKFDGKMSAYPGSDGSGSVDIEVCLLPETMNALEDDPLFLCPCYD